MALYSQVTAFLPNKCIHCLQHHLIPLPPRKKYICQTDTLVLEDKTHRINLTGNIPVVDLVTGVTIALLGHINDDGQFKVEEYCFAGDQPSFDLVDKGSASELTDSQDRYSV